MQLCLSLIWEGGTLEAGDMVCVVQGHWRCVAGFLQAEAGLDML